MDRWNTLNLELIICPYWANVLCVMRIYSPAGGKEYYSQMSMSPDTGTSTQIKSISPTSSSFLCRCTVIVRLNFWWRSSLKVWSSHSLHFSPPWSSIQGTQIFLVSLDSQLLLLYLQQPTGPQMSPQRPLGDSLGQEAEQTEDFTSTCFCLWGITGFHLLMCSVMKKRCLKYFSQVLGVTGRRLIVFLVTPYRTEANMFITRF